MPQRIAYFINQYPKVSHSFIRREILALEAAGFEVFRFALRTDPSELVDPLDKSELEKTRYLLQHNWIKILGKCASTARSQPKAFIHTLKTCIKMGLRSDRGLLRHFAYFAEACLLKDWLNENQIAHVHAHFGTNSAAVVMFSRLLDGPGYSFTVHGPEEFDKPEFLSIGLKIHHAQFVAAISSFTRSQLYRWADLNDWKKIQIVHCGLGADFIEQETLPLPENRRLVCVGRLCEQKGQLLLLEAAHQLAEKGLAFELILAGDGPMRPEIEAGIKRYALEKHVTITGWISSAEVRQHLIDARALVLPSFAEGLPVVIMEAMALARPVITTYIAGIPELVRDKESGWLVPAGDIERLVSAMQEALESPTAELTAMGQAGQRAVRINHNITTECEVMGQLINQHGQFPENHPS